ncbi:MAG: ExbD/TolR family protein [Phycisphaerales bacterium]
MLSRRRSALDVYESHHGPNMTPMVDIVMVILIFFMASAAMLGPEWFLPASLSRAGASTAPADPAPNRRIEVALAPGPSGPRAIIDGASMSLADFESKLRQDIADVGAAHVTVVITPDPKVSYDSVVAAQGLCAKLGVSSLELRDR